MKKTVLIAFVLSLCAIAHAAAPEEVVPAVFSSRRVAESYVTKLPAGGSVDVLRYGGEEVIVVYVYGSGVPDIAIAAYRMKDGVWQRAALVRPSVRGLHRAIEKDGAIVIVAGDSDETETLLPAEPKRANQALLPTTMSVTPRACARVAPDTVAADL